MSQATETRTIGWSTTPRTPAPSARTHRGSGGGRRKSPLTAEQRQWIIGISVLGCLLATFLAGSSPTGHRPIDAFYRCAFVVLTILAASRARRWSLVIAAGLTVIGSTTLMLIPPLAALVLAGTLAWRNKRDRVLGALVGMLVGWSALNLVWPTTTGLTAVLAAVAVVPLWISGYRVARTKNRRRIRIGMYTAIAILFLGCVIAGLGVVSQRNVLTTAANDTIDAAKGMTGVTTQESAIKFARVASRFDSAARYTGALWTLPAKLVPVVAQNLDAIHQAATSGADVTRTAAEIAGGVDYDRLQLADGGIDLAVLASFEDPVERAEAVITAVDERINGLDSPWIVRPLREKLDSFASKTGPLRDGAEIAALAVRQLPGMLGGAGERRYLMLLGNPAEARDIGGHIGTFAELTATNGKLHVGRIGGPYELFGPGGSNRPVLTDPSVLPPAMLEMNPTRFPQNWGASPDMTAVAGVTRQLFPQVPGGSRLDGVLYADPHAFAAVLSLVEPVVLTVGDFPGAPTLTIDADNAVSFLTRDQFIFGENADDPVKTLVRTSLDRLTSNRLPAISAMVDEFGPVIEQGRLQLVSFHDGDDQLLRKTGLDQPFAQPKGGDLFAVVDRSGFPSKIDSYLQRSITYRISWDPNTGAVRANAEIILMNAAPPGGLPDLIARSPEGTAPGTNRTVLSVITPFDLVSSTVDDAELPVGTRPETGKLKRHSFLVDLAPGQMRTVRVDLTGSVARGSDYRLRFYNQPLVNLDTSKVIIRSTGRPFIGGAQSGAVTISDSSGADRIADLRLRTER